MVSDDGKLVTIQGNCTTDEIYAVMHGQGAGASATEVHFANSLTIQTLQTGASSAPFANVASLEKVTSASNTTVLFEGYNGADPTLQYFFFNSGTSALTSLDGLSAWNVGNVMGYHSMLSMFQGCTNLTSLDGLSAWNVGNVTGNGCMTSMFQGCTNLTSLDGLSAWNVGKVNGMACMQYMFYGCTNLTSLDGLSAWNVGKVRGDDCMGSMFYGCTSLTSLDGLSAWNVGNVNGYACMGSMFYGCTSLTSLDGLSAWNVGNVNGMACMQYMFRNCTSLISLDAIASWNIDGAISSYNGVKDMFSGCTKIASITLGGANGFKLSSTMNLPVANWWSSKAGLAVTSDTQQTVNLYTESTNIDTYGTRWQRCADSTTPTNPMKQVSSLEVTWPQTNADSYNLTYNGLFQTLGTTDNKVVVKATLDGETNPVTLTEGADFYVCYKENTEDTETKEQVAIKDAGIYTARIVLRGAYLGADSSTIEVTMDKLNLAGDTYNVKAYATPNHFSYTGSAHTPKTMVRLYLRDDPNPDTTKPSIPIYTYLVENTDTRKEGDYTVTYTSDTEAGTATATVDPATPEGRVQSNLKNTMNAYFAIGDYFVTFDSCGGTSVPEQGTVNGLLTKPTDPTKEGYVFDGWYTENTYIHKWDFATDTISSNATLYAKWADAVTVTFDSNGGSEVKPQTIAKDTVAEKPADPIREGYNFLYWCTDTELTTEFDFSTPITADITLYAKWEAAPEPGPEPTPTSKEGWEQDDTGWRYFVDNDAITGWRWIDDTYGAHWYFFDDDTYMVSLSWLYDQDAHSWYWVCSTGPMITKLWQWIDNEWYGFYWDGKMCTGWVWDTDWNAWFYCYQNGIMARNTWIDAYWVDWRGIWLH